MRAARITKFVDGTYFDFQFWETGRIELKVGHSWKVTSIPPDATREDLEDGLHTIIQASVCPDSHELPVNVRGMMLTMLEEYLKGSNERTV